MRWSQSCEPIRRTRGNGKSTAPAKRLPIEQSTTYFESRGAAQEAGKKALTELLAKLSA